MGCGFSLPSAFELEIAYVAYLILGSAALPFLQAALGDYVASLGDFARCLLMM